MKTRAIILGYSSKQAQIFYKGYMDIERQPLPPIVRKMKEKEKGEE